ncbi:hypothetical protein Q1695_013794 [Nippostrongylus brasiliensis]|nr:hypothetical protein Q1695_013794 [Nippostrongylus brasiliensis]
MPNMKFLTALYMIFLSFVAALATLEHQWVTWESGAGEVQQSLDELPVLHTAFVQTGEELHYFSESGRFETEMVVGHRVQSDTSAGGGTKAREKKYNVRKLAGDDALPIEFDPPYVEFGDTAVGHTVRRRIFVRSRLHKPIMLDSIVGATVNFHISFFNTVEISPLGTAFFEVAFLPREEGKTSVAIHIRTSVGVFIYELAGRSSTNPYRIAPFVGTRLPFNGTISKDIILHNPFSSSFRITEIVSTGGNVHVEMAYDIDAKVAGEPLQYWDIRPFQTKTICRAVVVGHLMENTTVFVRVSGLVLDDNGNDGVQHSIVLPIPIEVNKRRGVFTTKDILDFGLLRQGERSQPQMFSVYQYMLNGKLEFETLYVDKGDPTGIYMEFASTPPIAVLPGKNSQPGKPSDLVKVFFDASRITFESQRPGARTIHGRIIALSRGGNYNVTMPFRVTVYQGDITSVGNDLALQEDIKAPHRRSVRLHNALPFPVAIWNISISPDASQYFTVRLFNKTTVIGIDEEQPVFLLKYNKRVPDSFGQAVLYVHTNVSTYRVQLWKYSGKIQVELFSVDQEMFDFGLLERNDSRTIRFVIRNKNHAVMTVRSLSVPRPSIHRLYLVSILGKNVVGTWVHPDSREEWPQGADLEIPPHSAAFFDFELRLAVYEPVLPAQMVIATEFESKVFPVKYEVAQGSLTSIPDRISFGKTHPGKVVYMNLQIFNSFAEDMKVTRLSTASRDPRFFFEGFDPAHPPVLRSGRLTNLGRVMFLPETPCSHEYCYLGLPLHTTDGQWFVHGLTLPANLAEVDSYLYKKQRARFDNLVKNGKHRVNTTVIIDTDRAKNIQIESTAEMVWPRLLTRNSVHFPLTALGNFTIVNLTLANPTSVPIAVQVIPLVIYPDADAVVEFFREHLITPLTSEVEMNETLMFSLRDTELFTLKPDSPVPKLREELEAAIPQTVPRFTLSLLLKPHMKVRLRLGFLPSDYTLRSSLLLIRNNLTVIEPVVVYGRGARIGMRVENREARSRVPLLFEIRHDHLSDCNNPKRLMHKLSSTLTVRRPFLVMNSGEVPFTVVNMSINGVPCENRGFRILNCYPFRLQPNETYSLDVAYTPDFLTTTNEADLQLYMHMNGSSWLFPLQATVPEDMLARCHRALPRPPFENLMYYSCVTALVFCLVCVLACAYLEGDRAIACAIRQHHSTPRSVFDLNNLDTKKNGNAAVDGGRPGAGGKSAAWNEASPSGLHAAADASVVLRVFYQAANSVLRAVHFVWRISLLYRNDKQDQPKKENKKKKKAQVSVIHSKAKEMKEKEMAKEKADAQPSANVKGGKLKHSTQPQHQQQQQQPQQQVQQQQSATTSGKKVQPVAPMHKLSAKLSMSPKAPSNQRKKSGGFTEADRRLARAQQLMDGDMERNTVPANEANNVVISSSSSSTSSQSHIRPSGHKREDRRREDDDRESLESTVRQKPQPVPVAPVQQKRPSSPAASPAATSAMDVGAASPLAAAAASMSSFPTYIPATSTAAMTTSMPTSRPSVIPVSAVHPTVYPTAVTGSEPIPIPVMLPVIPTLLPGLTLPINGMDMTQVSLDALAEYYGHMVAYDESNLPATPTPSLASSIGNDRTGGQRDMTPNSGFGRSRRRSDSEQSVASELSAVPDWLDEVVGPDDVDDDFSAMAAASEFLMSVSGEDGGSSRAQTPQPTARPAATSQQPQKKRTRRDKRRRGGRSSGNESASSSDKSYHNTPGAERASKKTLAAELNEERRRREDEYLRNNTTGSLGDWPMPDLHLGSLIEADERVAMGSGLWPPTPIGSRTAQWAENQNQQSSSAVATPPNMSYDPMSFGLSLGTTVAPVDQNAPFNIFGGADFNVWSSSAVCDSINSWNSVVDEPDSKR